MGATGSGWKTWFEMGWVAKKDNIQSVKEWRFDHAGSMALQRRLIQDIARSNVYIISKFSPLDTSWTAQSEMEGRRKQRLPR